MERNAFPAANPAQETDRLYPRVRSPYDFLGAGGPPTVRRAILVALIAWVPLALLSAVQGLAWRHNPAESFLCDIAAYVRFLIAAPLLVLAEAVCLPKMEAIARHFRETETVTEEDQETYHAIVVSTARLFHVWWAYILIVMLAYASVAALQIRRTYDMVPYWEQRGQPGTRMFSLAGEWNLLVSQPLLLVLVYGWIWRQFLWSRFLWKVSRLRLRLIPAHPDQAGGLGFVRTVVRRYSVPSFALGAIFAGAVANLILYHHAHFAAFKPVLFLLAAFVLLLFLGPLLIFWPTLRRARARGIFVYGTLAGSVGWQLEQKWLPLGAEGIDAGALEAPDFSATTDLNSITSNVWQMNDLPFTLKNASTLVLAVLAPFLPVMLLEVPLKELLEKILRLLH